MLKYVHILVLAAAIVLMIWVIRKCTSLRSKCQTNGKTLQVESRNDWVTFEVSCTSSTDHVKAESISKRKHNKKKTRGHSEHEKQTVVKLCQTPRWIHVQGPLAHTTQVILFSKIYNELLVFQNRQQGQNLQVYLHKKFDMGRKDDMAMMSLIQGINASRYINGDTQHALTQCKQLQSDIKNYHLKNRAIVEAILNWAVYVYYIFKGKPGKAHSALQAAVSCMQHHAPSAWSALVCELQGLMYDRLAQVRPGHRRKYQDLALRCFTNARDHCLYQPCQEDEDYVFYPLYYILSMVSIKLDMPTLGTIAAFCDTDIVYQRLSECVVSNWQVIESQNLLSAVIPHLTSLTARHRDVLNERICICSIIVNIRLTQLAISDKAHHLALTFMDMAEGLYYDFCDYAKRYTHTDFEDYPHLPSDIKKVIENLNDRLTITYPPSPQQEPFSDSVSSEPSDSPPSGLKQLTDESRRAEKQARRDAHQFSYSSGDIYTDCQDDVYSDVN